MREQLHIGEVAALVGVSPKAIRYYHEVGLLSEPGRTGGGLSTVHCARFVAVATHLQLLGVSILLLAGMVLLIVKLPVLLSFSALVVLDGVMCIGLGKLCLSRVSFTKV